MLWAEAQKIKERQKRGYRKILEESEIPLVRSKRLKDDTEVMKRPPVPVYDRTFNDELWTQEWYMVRMTLLLVT